MRRYYRMLNDEAYNYLEVLPTDVYKEHEKRKLRQLMLEENFLEALRNTDEKFGTKLLEAYRALEEKNAGMECIMEEACFLAGAAEREKMLR